MPNSTTYLQRKPICHFRQAGEHPSWPCPISQYGNQPMTSYLPILTAYLNSIIHYIVIKKRSPLFATPLTLCIRHNICRHASIPQYHVQRKDHVIHITIRCTALVVEQNQQVPVRVGPLVASGPRPEEQQPRPLRQHLVQLGPYLVQYFSGLGSHGRRNLFKRQKYTFFSFRKKKTYVRKVF